MERLEFNGYEEFADEIIDTFDLLDDEYDDIAIIAKYDEAKEIIKELLYFEYDIASVELYAEEYDSEYILNIRNNEICCEKFKRDTGYITDESTVIYIMDNCSSAAIPYCKSKNLYEVSVGDINYPENDDEELETERTYTVNGKFVDEKTFNNYVSKFAPDLVDDEDNEDKDKSVDSGYSVTVKAKLDTNEAENIIRDMNKNLNRHVSDMFDMLYRPYLYEYRPHPIRFFW